MTTTFTYSSWKARAKVIYRATRQHAFNLAKFVSIYKTLLLIQKKLNNGKERNIDTFIAGLIGGYIVFGDRNAVNEQVRLVAYNPSSVFFSKDSWNRSCYTSFLEFLHPSFPEQVSHTTRIQDYRKQVQVSSLFPLTHDTSLSSPLSHGVQ